MSLYRIANNTTYSSLTASWKTNRPIINIKIGTNYVPKIAGFDGYENIPVLFSNDRLLQSSKIRSSDDVLDTQNNESLPITKNINLINNDDIIKSIPFNGFNN